MYFLTLLTPSSGKISSSEYIHLHASFFMVIKLVALYLVKYQHIILSISAYQHANQTEKTSIDLESLEKDLEVLRKIPMVEIFGGSEQLMCDFCRKPIDS